MNTYKKRNYRGKRGYSGRPHRRTADSYHQPMPPEQNRIPYARHTLTKPDVEAVVDALLSGSLTQGRELERFESLLSKLTHSDYAISFSSGTAAVHAALACLKLEPEDEVITSTLNFCSVANMITLVGARPVLADCDPNTLTLSVESAKAAITENTKAIFSNNFGGHPSDLLALRELCDEHNLILLEDASHGLGGKHRGHYVGNQADLTCFSFHPSKAITTCEGGAVTTGNRSIAEWLRQFRHHGIQKDARYFQSDEEFPGYYQELQFLGMNYRLSEIHAALGRSQLTRLDRHIERRRSIAQVYYQKLGSIEELSLPYVADWADNAFHLYPIQFTGSLKDQRNAAYQDLKAASVDTQVHYVPVHRMPLYAGKLGNPAQFPNAETYFGRALSLPLYPDLSYKEIERITELLNRFITKCLTEAKSYVPDKMEGEDASTEADAASSEEREEDFGPETITAPEHVDPEPYLFDEPHPSLFEERKSLEMSGLRKEPKEAAKDSGSAKTESSKEADTEEASEPKEKPAEEKKPRKTAARKTTRTRTRKTTPKETEEAPAEEAKGKDEPEEKPARPRRTRRTTKATTDGDAAEAKPARKTTTRKTTRKKAEDGEEKKPVRRRRTKAKADDADEKKAATSKKSNDEDKE